MDHYIIPINNNYLSVDAKDIVDKHDYPRAMYKCINKENQKRMINPIVGASHGSYPPWDEKSSFFHQANDIHKDKWLGYIVISIHNVYLLPRVML